MIQCGDVQYVFVVGYYLFVICQFCVCVEYFVVCYFFQWQVVDYVIGVVIIWIFICSYYYVERSVFILFGCFFVQFVFIGCQVEFNQIGFYVQYNWLGFRIVKVVVKFNNFWIVLFVDYQVCVEKIGVGVVFCCYVFYGWLDNMFYGVLMNVIGYYWCGGVSVYFVGVWFGIFIVYVFVILVGSYWQYMFVVYYYDKVCFFVIEEFFDNDVMICVVKSVVCQYIVNSCFCFFQCYCYDNVFFGSQIVCFNDDWCVFFMQICQCRFYFGEVLVFCCRDFMVGQEIFGKCF